MMTSPEICPKPLTLEVIRFGGQGVRVDCRAEGGTLPPRPPRSRSSLKPLPFELHRGHEPNGPVDPLPNVEALDVVEEAHLGLLAGAIAFPVDQLCLEPGEETLHGGVIVAVARPTHTHGDALVGQQGLIGVAGVLAVPVGVTEQLPPTAADAGPGPSSGPGWPAPGGASPPAGLLRTVRGAGSPHLFHQQPGSYELPSLPSAGTSRGRGHHREGLRARHHPMTTPGWQALLLGGCVRSGQTPSPTQERSLAGNLGPPTSSFPLLHTSCLTIVSSICTWSPAGIPNVRIGDLARGEVAVQAGARCAKAG